MAEVDDNLLNIDHDNEVLYRDDKITITDKEVILNMYYFPFGTKRVIPLRSIKSFKCYFPRSFLSMKSWGMGIDFDVWWHADFQRKWGDCHAIVLNTGEWPSAGITPGSGKKETVRRVQNILNRYIEQDEPE